MKKITILALLLTWGTATWAEENENQKTEEHKQVEESKRTSWNKYLHGYQYQARVAYNIGGTAPIGLPATIRTLHSYTQFTAIEIKVSYIIFTLFFLQFQAFERTFQFGTNSQVCMIVIKLIL